ncbi:MAG: protease complex subunit PrcB family protein [Caldilineales bacterium]
MTLVVCLAALVACAAPPAVPPAGEPVYEMVAQDVAYSGGSDQPIMLAIAGSDALAGAPAGLPPGVVDALQAAAAANPDALYIVVYTGMKPGGGYAVSIDSITLEKSDGSQSLVVTYSESAPQGASTTALTYPYVIARVLSPAVSPDNVRFVAGS